MDVIEIGTVFALIWSVIFLIISIGLAYIMTKLLYKSVSIKKRAIKHAKLIDEYTRNKVNRIVTLPVKEFEEYLTKIYTQVLELSAAKDVSDKDPNASTILYARSIEKIMLYLGNETLEAIEYYYGKDFIIRWCEMRFKILENNGKLSGIISKDLYSDDIENVIT